MKKVAFEFDPFRELGITPPKSERKKRAALKEAAEIVKTRVLEYVADQSSPVSGGKWKRTLSPEYKERKQAEGGSSVADMELSGNMLDALQVVITSRGKLSLQIEGSQAPKADGHNNHSGKSELPPREFIPKKGATFKRDIWRDVREALEEYVGEADR